MDFVRDVIQGRATVTLRGKCEHCGKESDGPSSVEEILETAPTVDNRLRAVDSAAKYGLGERSEYSEDVVAANVDRMLSVAETIMATMTSRRSRVRLTLSGTPGNVSSTTRIPIRGLSDRGSIARVTDAHISGERKVRPLLEYQSDPLGFLVDVLGIPRHTLAWSTNAGYEGHAWDGTVDPLVRMCDVLAGKVLGRKHAAVEAATGTQKTYTAAALVLWFLACFEDARFVVTTAPKERQLKENLWKEISAHLPQVQTSVPTRSVNRAQDTNAPCDRRPDDGRS